MQQALTYIFILFSLFNQKLNLEGTYCHQAAKVDRSKCYTFYSNGDFQFNSEIDFKEIYGKGSYKLKDDKLILSYKKLKPYHLSYYKSNKSISTSDSIQFKIKIKNLEQDAISTVNVGITNEIGYISNVQVADKKGCISFPVLKGDKPIKISLSDARFENLEINLDTKFNYDIEVFMAPKNQKIPVGISTDTLMIFKKAHDYLILISGSGEEKYMFKKFL